MRVLWRYRVKAGCEAAFCERYCAAGDWARLFARSAGYRGTALARDVDEPRRYYTVDEWTTAEALAEFKERNAAAYAALDASCDELTEEEQLMGVIP